MIIKVLLENNNILNEHGLSLYIEKDDIKILFDAGQSDLYLKNGKNLKIDFDEIDIVVLSHGHYDHGNGLKYLNNRKLICHPKVFTKRYRKDGTYIGLNLSRNEIKEKFLLIESKKPYYINKDICFLGEINKMPTKYKLEDGSIDYLPDDSALVINTDKGLVIITGCSHSGIHNIINYAKKEMKNDKIYSLIGGFHLKEIDNKTRNLIDLFKKIEKIYTGHCTSKKVIDFFIKKGISINKLETFMEIEL